MSYVIGVASQAQNGKDTLADYLSDKLNKLDGNLVWHKSAFAYAVKKVFCDTFGVSMEFIEEWKVNPEPPPGFLMPIRQCLQFIGDGFRKMKESVWLDIAFRDNKSKIFSDVRYINEFSRIKQEGGFNILIARPDMINDDPNGSEAQIKPYILFALSKFKEGYLGHQVGLTGEPFGMNLFDHFVINNGTKEELYQKIEKIILPFVQDYFCI